jgi:chromosome segregation ATPase
MKTNTTRKSKLPANATSDDVPVLQGELRAVKKQISSLEIRVAHQFKLVDIRFDQIDKRFEQVDKRFEQVDKRFEQVDKRFEQVDKRFDQIDKRFDQIDKRFENNTKLIMNLITNEIHKIQVLVEEQNSRNIAVLDAHNDFRQRQDNVETEIHKIKKHIGNF